MLLIEEQKIALSDARLWLVPAAQSSSVLSPSWPDSEQVLKIPACNKSELSTRDYSAA